MARKSRRANVVQEKKEELQVFASIITQKQLATAAYARLSVEKENDESIQTQIELLHQYIQDHEEYKLVDTYVDDGYTGTDFDRPEFIRLMDDVRTGKIQAIIVKDLSRFGRNFIETGYYIETIFPCLNVRLISINDEFDSSRAEDRNSITDFEEVVKLDTEYISEWNVGMDIGSIVCFVINNTIEVNTTASAVVRLIGLILGYMCSYCPHPNTVLYLNH